MTVRYVLYSFATEQKEEEARKRTCLFCNITYRAKNIKETQDICSSCKTPQLTHESNRVRVHVGKAKRRNLPATLTLLEWLHILNHFEWKCAYCLGKFQVLEHIVSVTRGGGTTSLNCVPA